MNLDFSEDQKQLKEQARRLFADKSPPSVVRAVLEGKDSYDQALWKNMAELGFLGTAIPEEFGGHGIGHLELCVIAEELGRSLAPVPMSSSIYLAAEFLVRAGSDAQKRKYLPKLASGALIGTFAHAERAGEVTERTIEANVARGALTGAKVPVPDGEIADFAVVSARAGDGGVGLFLVDLTGPGVQREAVRTIDPTRNQASIRFDNAPAEPLGAPAEGWRILTDVLNRAAVLVAFEQIGGADRALEMARDYALERFAFGRQIGSFQGLKHMMADMYVSATLARSNCYWAAWALSTDAAELPEAAATARVSATQAFQHCAKNNIQVHGGMGFTWEYDCHLYYRRSNLLALSLGSQSAWEDKLIDALRRKNAA
ncbi:MAG: acyl-CoA/acyl-ACP dehydrogenase [Alphaproteobacteria bacterium]|nr:acyl-CoA/acyl-ACP dehydrogenase [Alphaproteobacteria bacterium]